MKRRLFLTYLLIAALCIVLTAAVSFHSIQKTYTETVEQRLHQVLDTVSSWLHESAPADVSAWMDTHRGDFGCRLTIIGPDGWVVADTETDPETMDNHGARPEIGQALSQGSGSSIRYSDTLGMDMLYVAHPWGDDGSVIRAAIPLAQTFRQRDRLFLNLAGVLLLALLASAFLGRRFANTLSRPILDMAQLSQEIARGDFSKRILARGTPEVRNLAKAFNKMADSLDQTITDLGNKKNQLSAILQSMDSGVVAVDDRYNVILLNPAARAFFNIHEEGHRPVFPAA